MSRALALACCLLHAYVLVQATGYYSIIGPGTLRPNSVYNVAVSVQEATEPSTIRLSITGPNFERKQEVKVEPMSVENVEFKIPDILNGDYHLNAEGISGLIFSNSTALNYVDNAPSVYVQTDKATYKPGDLIQFRVIFLDENIRPAAIDKHIVIFIKDAAKNRVKQFANVTITKGVFSGNLQLSEFPLLGEWAIEVQIAGAQVSLKTILIDKYVLPKFEVNIEAPKQISMRDEHFGFTVRSKYTFGKGVKGKVTATIKSFRWMVMLPRIRSQYSLYQPYYLRNTPQISEPEISEPQISGHYPLHYPKLHSDLPPIHTLEKSVEFNGKEYLPFAMKDIYPDGKMEGLQLLEIFITVEEELTGNKQNSSAYVEVVKNSFNVDAPPANIDCVEADQKFNYSVTVTNLLGEPVNDAKNPVTFTPSTYSANKLHRSAYLNKSGIASVELECAAYSLSGIIVTYRGDSSHAPIVKKSRDMGKKFEAVTGLTVKLLTEKPALGKDIELLVESNEVFTHFVYTVVARGNVITSGLSTLPDGGGKTHAFRIQSTFDMVPTAKVYVHFIQDGHLKFYETSFQLEKRFQNEISIQAPRQAKPGEKLVLSIKTDPDSFVGLSGVDQSVLLLKSGNDFQKDAILKTLDNVLSITPKKYLHTQHTNQYPGSQTGVVTLTNAHYPFKKRVYVTLPTQTHNFMLYSARTYASSQSSHSRAPVNLPPQPLPAPQPPRVRKEFPENWFFDDFASFEGNDFTVTKRVPDTITSWVITGFSLNPKSGFALTEAPTKIETFRPFFIATNFPYSIKRGELVSIPIIVFNYMDQELEAEVTLENTENEFEFMESGDDQSKRVKRVSVASNGGESVFFSIRPNKIGHITLKISAISPVAGDIIQKELKVEPEGVTVYRNRDYYVHAEENGSGFADVVNLDIPEDIVPDSEHIEVSVMGDILGSTITNLDKLIRLPAGCGEQNMVNFVPNILVLRYLESIHQISPSIEEKAKRFMEIGYQRELTYKHDNGSYSAFGKSDKAGSTWLTAYVMRSFHQAAKYIDIDPKVLSDGLQFLATQQANNGSFLEHGKVLDFSHHNDVGLTAFVLLAFLENSELADQYVDVINRGFQYLQENIKATDDLYATSIAVYTLQLRNLEIVNEILKNLDVKSRIDGGHKWWSKAAEERLDQAWRPKSHDVEVTAYILLTLLEKNESVLPITKWLISQRNSNGGFASTQETVVGLQALIKFAEKSGAGNSNLKIDINSSDGSAAPHLFEVNNGNSLVLQTLKLENSVRKINFNGKGSGTAILQISYRYNILKKDDKPSFKLSAKIQSSPTPAKLLMNVCAEFVPQATETESKESNMVVVEVSLPSGYTAESESFDKIKEVEGVKRVETKNGDTNIIVYFDSLKASETQCIPINAERVHEVSEQKPTPIVIYDYYDSQKRATEFYQV